MHKRSIPYNKTHAKHTWSQKNIIVTQENIAEMSQKYSFLSRIESCMCAANLTLPTSKNTIPTVKQHHAVRPLIYQ